MGLAQLRDEYSLTFGYTSVIGVEFAITTYLIDLVKCEMVRIQITGRIWATVFQDFV